MSFKSTLYLLLILVLFGCAKDNTNQVPYAPVNIQVNINNPQYIDLNHPGGWVYMSGGVKGLILFRKDESTINAFDRLSPYPSENGCTVKVDSSEVFALDTCTSSKWLLFDGSPNSGPAKRGLIQYSTTLNGSILTISN